MHVKLSLEQVYILSMYVLSLLAILIFDLYLTSEAVLYLLHLRLLSYHSCCLGSTIVSTFFFMSFVIGLLLLPFQFCS